MLQRFTALLSLAVLLLVAGCDQTQMPTAPATDAPAAQEQSGDVIPGQYIVVLDDELRGKRAGATVTEFVQRPGVEARLRYEHVLRGFAGTLSDEAVEALRRDPRVKYVEPDRPVYAWGSQTNATWGLDRVDQRDNNLDQEYTYNTTGAGVTAYILDTGIRTSHNDFGGRATAGFDAIGDGQNGEDCNGHGTHVAGTVGGGTWGVAKDVSLVAVRVLDCEGSGTTSGVIAGIDWVTANAQQPAVANMSLGGGSSDALDDAVRSSISSGVQYAVAAGNGDFIGREADACNYSPARVAEAITIGATDESDTKASWSNYGSCVDWFAPGVSITSAWIGGDDATNTISGTSMATPHTAGAAALYLETTPGATPQQVRDALYDVTTKSVVADSRTENNHLLYTLVDDGGSGGETNTAPTADFTYSAADLSVDFTDASTDSDGTIAGWSWDVDGDGAEDYATQNPSHTYGADGTYTVSLTVTDDDGATGTTAQDVTVSGGDTGGSTAPAIDQFGTSTRTTGPWTRATVSWAVSDADTDLAQVTTELLDGTNVVDTQTSSVSGSSASGEHELRTRGSADAVRLTVVDAAGNETVDTQAL